MHPALSVIFFTVTSGAGYGILALMGVLMPLGLISASPWFASVSLLFALTLVSLGLISSTLHLRHPERAWRAISQWRSSWLSREGVAALSTYAPALLFGFGWIYLGEPTGPWGLWGFVLSALAMTTIFSTSMIYASLKSIPRWHHPLVPPLYLALGLATGAVWLVALSAMAGEMSELLVRVALIALILSAALKFIYWRSIDQLTPKSDIGSATGLGSIGAVRQLEAPQSGENWVMREMGFLIARKHALKLRRIAGLFAFAIPLIGLGSILMDMVPVVFVSLLTAISISIGVGTERWLFFAEAKHVVGLFYGKN